MRAELTYRLSSKLLENGQTRHLIFRRRDNQPNRAAGIYESFLHRTKDSPNTVAHNLWGLVHILSYGEGVGIDFETRFLAGQPMLPAEIQGFSHWLTDRLSGGGVMTSSQKLTHNRTIAAARGVERWFVEMHLVANTPMSRSIEVDRVMHTQSSIWKRMTRRVTTHSEADDLEDNDVAAIETYLRGRGLGENADPIGARLYLTWRLAIEFGLRIGEILALRIEDCPTRTRNTFRIIRIEDRGGLVDPRGPKAPRPKTLGRELGLIFANTAFPHLTALYCSEHRHGWKTSRKGLKIKDWALDHPYLIVDSTGAPLSTRSAGNDAAEIRAATGIDFTWHRARHAFFNRAYAAVAEIGDINAQNARMMDLVYWGGWSDPGSLEIYTRRARRMRARDAFKVWQIGGSRWDKLE